MCQSGSQKNHEAVGFVGQLLVMVVMVVEVVEELLHQAEVVGEIEHSGENEEDHSEGYPKSYLVLFHHSHQLSRCLHYNSTCCQCIDCRSIETQTLFISALLLHGSCSISECCQVGRLPKGGFAKQLFTLETDLLFFVDLGLT